MAGPNENLRRAAIAIVAERQPCSPYDLLEALRRDYGASHGAANTTMLTLIRDGLLERTFDGRLVLPGVRARTSMGRMVVLAVFLIAILAFMTWVIYNMATR
jgi:hypothetical protein